MKTIKLLVLGIILAFAGSAQSQLSVNVNIGTPPAWGPRGYEDVRYYYIPDVDAYYDVQTAMFIYISGNRWIHRSYLPNRYRNYDLYHGLKVVMKNYHGNTPYYTHKQYKAKYGKGYQGNQQQNYGNRNAGNGNHKNVGNQKNNKNDRNSKKNKNNRGNKSGR
jgi:hypothetical protein